MLSQQARVLCSDTRVKSQQIIGGPGSTAEIDESLFGKLKYGSGPEINSSKRLLCD